MKRDCARHAFSLVEVIISVLIVGGVMAAVLNTIGATATIRRMDADRVRGEALAQDMLDEILSQNYEDDGEAAGSFGLTGGESATGDRSTFDDVDDYDGWSMSPPERADGTQIAGFTGWKREASVVWVDPSDPDTSSGSDTRLKRITVRVYRGSRQVASATTLRSAALDELQ